MSSTDPQASGDYKLTGYICMCSRRSGFHPVTKAAPLAAKARPCGGQSNGRAMFWFCVDVFVDATRGAGS